MHRNDAPDVAHRQDGVFTARQALDAGWSPGQVRRRRASGRWIVVAGRGLTVGPTPQGGFAARALARAALLTWPHAVVCRRTAAAVLGLPVAAPDTAEVLTIGGQRTLPRLRPHTPPCESHEVTLVDGLRVTDLRTSALDCLAFLPFDEALDLHAWLITHAVITRADVITRARAWRGRPGVAQLTQLAEVTRSGAVSGGEHRLHQLLTAGRLRGWRANAQVVVEERVVAVADVLFEAERVVIEVDGLRAHSRREAFVQDRRRQNALLAAGFLVLRFTWWDLTERPDAVLAEIRHALRR